MISEAIESKISDESLENDIYENSARAHAGRLPIVWRGTDLDDYNKNQTKDGIYTGFNGKTYWAYNPHQALTFAKVNGGQGANPVMLRIDLETCKGNINVKRRQDECIIIGGVPTKYIEAYLLKGFDNRGLCALVF